MKNLLTFMLVLAFSRSAVADVMNVDGLTDEQKAQVALQVAQMKDQKPAIEVAQEWAELGEAIGTGFGAAARELGITVNEFASTPVGKFTAVIIAWKFIGKEILRIIVFIPMFVLITFILLYIHRRVCVIASISYHDNGKKKEVMHFDGTQDWLHGTRFLLAVVWVASFLGCMLGAFI